MITQSRCFSPLNVNSRVRKLHESSPSFKNLRIVKKYKKMCALSCVCKVLLISLPALTFIYRPRRALSEPKYVRSASLGAPRRSKVAPSSSIRLRRWGRTRIAYITIFILAVSREKEGPNTRHRASIYYWARRESRGESLSKSITQIVRRQLLSKLTYECLRERKTSGLVDIVLNEGFSSLELFFFYIRNDESVASLLERKKLRRILRESPRMIVEGSSRERNRQSWINISWLIALYRKMRYVAVITVNIRSSLLID